MYKTLKVFLFFMLIIFTCQSQETKTINFIPKGYIEFEKYFGDLNKDGQKDCVLLIKKTDTNNIVINRFDEKVDRNRRGIIILFKNKKGYQIANKNYNCFSSENEDGGVYFPPELSIYIKNEKLYVHYGHGRYGHWKYTFRFQNSNFELIGYDSSSNRGPITNIETSINFLTKKKLIKEKQEGSDEIFNETWDDIKIKKLIKLTEIKDFDKLDIYNY